MDNKQWSEKLLSQYDPLFKHRWEIYDEILKDQLDTQKVWIDCGCGNNETVKDFIELAKVAIGVDIIDLNFANINKSNFIKADIKQLPLPSDYADLITLRFVVEHFNKYEKYFNELARVIKKGGRIIILTTNLLCPFIIIPRLLLPYRLKNRILTGLFKVKDKEIFPTFHNMNTPNKFKKLSKTFRINKVIFISDLNYIRKWVFILYLIWHKLTAKKFLNKFRTNILVILEKL